MVSKRKQFLRAIFEIQVLNSFVWYILGKVPTVEEPTSCQDLKRSGFSRSTYYMMKNDDGNLAVSYCNMESFSGYDEDKEMEEPIGNWIISESNAFEELNTTVGQLKSDIVRNRNFSFLWNLYNE